MKKVGAAILLSLLLCLTLQAQALDEKYAKLSKALEDEISREMIGWSCKAFSPSKGVLIQHWSSGDIGVKVALVEYLSPARAAEVFRESKSHLKIEEEAATRNRGREIRLIKDSLNLGDEGFVRDNIGSDAVEFRKGSFLISVSIFSPNNSKDVYFSRKFAGLAATALDSVVATASLKPSPYQLSRRLID